MRRLRILWCALFAILAVGAISATTAFAEEEHAQWLDNGALISTKVPVLSELMTGLLLEDMGNGAEIECMIGDNAGFVGPEAADETTEAICLEALPIAVCSGATTINALLLPWTTTLESEGTGANEMFYDLTENATTKEIGYETECTVLGLKVKDVCLGPGVRFLVENDGTTGTVLVESDELTELDSELGKCSISNGKPLVLAGSDGLIFSDETGLAITVSLGL
jgi:hypothetical protein